MVRLYGIIYANHQERFIAMNFKAVTSLCLVVAVQVAFGTLTVTDYASEKRATVDVDAGEADSSL